MERIDVINPSRTLVMGILNCTPDSFYDGGVYDHEHGLLKRIDKLVEEGADIIDVGGQSTRPGAAFIDAESEWQRVQQAIEYVASQYPNKHLSIDTFHASVAELAVNAGASIINDVSGGQLDVDMFDTVARLNVPYILMHMKGTPSTMKDLCQYDDLIGEVKSYFSERIQVLQEKGFQRCIIDPGFGFAKNLEQNYELLHRLAELKELGAPILCGLSRKSMLYRFLGISADEALNATTTAQTIALINGCDILRVHDVRPAVECCKIVRKTGY